MAIDVFALQLSRRPDYQGLDSQARAALANDRGRNLERHSEKRTSDWLLHHFDPVMVNGLSKLLWETGQIAIVTALAANGLPFDTDKMQAGMEALKASHPTASPEDVAFRAFIDQLKELGLRQTSDYEKLAGDGAVATPEMFDQADVELNKDDLLALVKDATDRATQGINAGTLTTAAAVRAELAGE